jgi:hypothetical protein
MNILITAPSAPSRVCGGEKLRVRADRVEILRHDVVAATIPLAAGTEVIAEDDELICARLGTQPLAELHAAAKRVLGGGAARVPVHAHGGALGVTLVFLAISAVFALAFFAAPIARFIAALGFIDAVQPFTVFVFACGLFWVVWHEGKTRGRELERRERLSTRLKLPPN